MFKEKEVKDYIGRIILREKIINYENIDNDENNEILYRQNEDLDKIQEGADTELLEEMMTYQNMEDNKTLYQPIKMQEDDFNLNRSSEKITTTYEDAEVRQAYDFPSQKNEEPYEEEADKNNLLDDPIIVYNSRKELKDNETLPQEIEQSNKLQEDIKIMRQMVQGKIDLQDY